MFENEQQNLQSSRHHQTLLGTKGTSSEYHQCVTWENDWNIFCNVF